MHKKKNSVSKLFYINAFFAKEKIDNLKGEKNKLKNTNSHTHIHTNTY